MTRPDRASLAATAPLDELLTLLLRQFKRPLLARGVTLTDAEADAIAALIVNRAPLTDRARSVREGLLSVVQESEAVLRGWGLTFQQSLKTGMNAIPGWESTAEFLEVANEKANAELRIAAASSLVLALGDPRFRDYVLFLAQRPDDDMDSLVARRVLLFVDEEKR